MQFYYKIWIAHRSINDQTSLSIICDFYDKNDTKLEKNDTKLEKNDTKLEKNSTLFYDF
jgi:hypothetical protein